MPIRVLRQLEQASAQALGKGWGAGTVSSEVNAALSLLPLKDRLSPVVLDVGANIGLWTSALLTAAPDAKVFCFEPSSTAFAQLSARFEDSSRVRLINAAVGDECGTAELSADAPGSTLGSLYTRRLKHFGIEFDHCEVVQLLSLDGWCAEESVAPDVLKLDIEGHELSALRGVRQALSSIKVVQFEFGGCNIDSRTYFQDFFYFFEEAGFRLHRLGPKGLDHVERYTELDEVFVTTNYFAQRICTSR